MTLWRRGRRRRTKWWRRMGRGRWREWGWRLWSQVPTSPISPNQRRSCLPSTDLTYPPRRSRLPSIDLSSPFHFFSFFLHSSPISPEFFFCGYGLIFLAWVVVGFIFVVVGWLWFFFFFWGLIIRGLRLCLVVEKMKENHSFYSFRDKPMNPIWVLS